MYLASSEALHPDELRADFQQYYNLNIDGMGVDYSIAHAAILCAQLPSDSRLRRAYDPDAALTLRDYYLREIEHDLRVIAWQRTKDAQNGSNYPVYIPLPSDNPEHHQAEAIARREYVDAVLASRG